jgi:hypothetical protein
VEVVGAGVVEAVSVSVPTACLAQETAKNRKGRISTSINIDLDFIVIFFLLCVPLE